MDKTWVMDPDDTLAVLRDLTEECLGLGDGEEIPPQWWGYARDAMAEFRELDKWLSSGGHAPRAWRPRPAPANAERTSPEQRPACPENRPRYQAPVPRREQVRDESA